MSGERAEAAAGKRPWLFAFSTVSLVQMEASFLMICLPVCGPVLTGAFHLAPQRIGVIGASIWGGALAFVFVGGFVLNRFRPVTLFQIVMLAEALGIAFALTGSKVLLFLGAVLIGLGYGPNIPAGSTILAARTPPSRSGILFSLKQGAVSIGNVLGGLILAPLAAYAGYRGAVGLAAATGLAAFVLLIFAARRIDVPAVRGPQRRHRDSLVAPVRALARNRRLRVRAVLAFALASTQSICTNFLVAYLVTRIGFPMGHAGLVFAVLQGAGFVGRLLAGWLADATGTPGRNLAIQAMVAALAMVGLASVTADTPVFVVLLLAALAGVSALGWNGVFIAEAARLAGKGAVAETTAGAVSVIYFARVIGPGAGDLIVSTTGSWPDIFLAAAALAGTLSLVVIRSEALAPPGGVRRRDG